jgi:hypothetical protein
MGRHWDAVMLRQAVERLAAPVTEPPYGVVACDNPNVWTSLLSDGENSLLFLMNLFTGPLTCTVRCRNPRTGEWQDGGTYTLPGISVKIIEGS